MKNKIEKRIRKIPIKINYPTPRGDVELKILALPKDLQVFTRLDSEEQSKIWEEFVYQARLRAGSQFFKKPRGRYIDTRGFTSRVRVLATDTYSIVRDLVKNHSRTRFLENLVKEYNKKYNPYSRDPERFKPKPHEITAFIIESIFGKERERFGIKEWTDDVESFRRIYIDTRILRTRHYESHREFIIRIFASFLRDAGTHRNSLKTFRIFYGRFFDEPRFEEIVKPRK